MGLHTRPKPDTCPPGTGRLSADQQTIGIAADRVQVGAAVYSAHIGEIARIQERQLLDEL